MTIGTTEMIVIAVVVFLIIIMMSRTKARVDVIDARTRALLRIDDKLDLLLRQAGIKYDPHKNVPPDIREALQRGEKIRAIQLYRAATGAGLKESKDAIEAMQLRF
jgi:ribosomal protein L7/L12